MALSINARCPGNRRDALELFAGSRGTASSPGMGGGEVWGYGSMGEWERTAALGAAAHTPKTLTPAAGASVDGDGK
jgi:hypothetical protein